LDVRKGIWPLKTYVTYPQRFFPEQMEEENQGKPANPVQPGKQPLKQK